MGVRTVKKKLMNGKIDYRSLVIEDLIERGLGCGDSLGERFHARTYSLEGFFSLEVFFLCCITRHLDPGSWSVYPI